MKNISQIYTAATNANNTWWKAAVTAEKLNPPTKPEYTGHENNAVNEIHANPNLTREEKLAAARAVLAEAKTAAEPAPVPAIAVKAPSETKSKVCIIANRLSKQGLNRSEAFRRAWATVKAGTVATKAAGVTVGRRQEALERLTHYEPDQIKIDLQREATNAYDSNAIQIIVTVQNKGSYFIGYLSRQLAALIAPLIDAQRAVRATFKEVRGKYHSYHNLGMVVSVSV